MKNAGFVDDSRIINVVVSHFAVESKRAAASELVHRLDTAHNGFFLNAVRSQIVDAMKNLWTTPTCHAAKALGTKSGRAWTRLLHILFYRWIPDNDSHDDERDYLGDPAIAHDDERGTWKPHVLYEDATTTIHIPVPKSWDTVNRYELKMFLETGVMENDDRKAIHFPVQSAIMEAARRLYRRAGLKVPKKPPTKGSTELHFSGDAGTLQLKMDGTSSSLQVVGRLLHLAGLDELEHQRDVMCTQSPDRIIVFDFYEGKDSYVLLAPGRYGAKTFADMEELRKTGLQWNPLGDDARDALRVAITGGGDWLFLRTMNGLMDKPTSSYPCPFCIIHRDQIGDSKKFKKLAVPRDMMQMFRLAHCLAPDDPLPTAGSEWHCTNTLTRARVRQTAISSPKFNRAVRSWSLGFLPIALINQPLSSIINRISLNFSESIQI